MLATNARTVPDMALAWLELPSALKTMLSPSFFTSTFGSAARATVPSGPFTEIWPPARFTSTPFGSDTGYLAIRDMVASGNDAENFAANAVGACFAVGHDAARGRQDRHAQAVHHLRNVVATLVDAQSRLRDALEALDHRPASVVLQADGELLLHALIAQGEVLDVALVLQDLGDRSLELGSRHRHFRMPDQLGIADARQHVGDGVAHAHSAFSLPARLDDARNFALQRQVAQLAAAEAELAVHAPRPSGEGAAVAQPHRRGIARQLLELGACLVLRLVGGARVLHDFDQLGASRLELGDDLDAFLLPEDD